jgi:hypothetical protein
LRGVNESLFPSFAPKLLDELLGELQEPTDGSKTEGLFWIGIFLDDGDSYRFRLPGHCGIHFACDFIESKPVGAYIILTDSLASIEGLKSTGISYRTNDMLFWTRRSLKYLEELGYDISLMYNELQEKLRAVGVDHGRSIRDVLAIRNMVALRIIFEYSKDMGLHI